MEDRPNQHSDTAASNSGCLDPEQLEMQLRGDGSPEERRVREMHLKECATCSTELELLRRFMGEEPSAGERADVDWIAANLRSAQAAAPQPSQPSEPSWLDRVLAGLRGGGWAWAGAAAMAMLAVAIFVSTGNRPGLPGGLGEGPVIQRSGDLEVVEPSGDLDATPPVLRVEPFSGAARYRFEIRAIDRTVVWSAESAEPSATIPEEIRALAVPGKTLVWSATAVNNAGEDLATSPPTRFRVALEPGR